MTSSQLVESLQNPKSYPHPVNQVTLVETHISWVFLTGQYVYKIKKPVDLGFLDFTTLEKRRYFCQQEVDLNRRLAPDVYLGVIPITADKNCYLLAGPGEAVEYAVKMRQLPDDLSMRKLLRRGKVNEIQIRQLCFVRTRIEIFLRSQPKPFSNVADRCKAGFGRLDCLALLSHFH